MIAGEEPTERHMALLMPGATMEDSFWVWLPEGGDLPGLNVTLGLPWKEPYELTVLADRGDADYAREQAAMESALTGGRLVLVSGRPVLPDACRDTTDGQTPLANYATADYFDLWEIQIVVADATQPAT